MMIGRYPNWYLLLWARGTGIWMHHHSFLFLPSHPDATCQFFITSLHLNVAKQIFKSRSPLPFCWDFPHMTLLGVQLVTDSLAFYCVNIDRIGSGGKCGFRWIKDASSKHQLYSTNLTAGFESCYIKSLINWNSDSLSPKCRGSLHYPSNEWVFIHWRPLSRPSAPMAKKVDSECVGCGRVLQ